MAREKWIIAPGHTRVIDIEVVRSLKVSLLGGQIDIIGHDEPGARVEVHSVLHRDLKISIDGDVLDIDHPQLRWDNVGDLLSAFGRNSAKASVSVLVPRAIAVTLGSVSADALVTGLTTRARLSTVSGEIQTEGLEGDLVLHSVSGELSAQNHLGAVSADSVSGDVTLSGRIDRVKVDTVSGDVFADIDGRCDRIRVNSVSGALTARVDDTLGAAYTVNTVSGTLQLDGEVVKGMRGRGYHQTIAGVDAFSVEVVANTVSGDVSVVRRAARPDAAERDGHTFADSDSFPSGDTFSDDLSGADDGAGTATHGQDGAR
ncbi:DUF4097 family beta strand repeat-containing protein [Labedella endophytica]|uniref:DUF4097 family beta strand repeat-containing protein n=1 Tax=Labedella endophytica TaxID=1523160 RepID=UPI001AA0817A|nr:DUF4097 family beta strand repeat-containing protein [Labedella endophytica]